MQQFAPGLSFLQCCYYGHKFHLNVVMMGSSLSKAAPSGSTNFLLTCNNVQR